MCTITCLSNDVFRTRPRVERREECKINKTFAQLWLLSGAGIGLVPGCIEWRSNWEQFQPLGPHDNGDPLSHRGQVLLASNGRRLPNTLQYTEPCPHLSRELYGPGVTSAEAERPLHGGFDSKDY